MIPSDVWPHTHAAEPLAAPPMDELSFAQVSGPQWPAPPAKEAYHGIAGDFVQTVLPETESDPVALLAQFLLYFGNCAGHTSYLPVEASKHTTNINLILVGNTAGGRKGTSEAQVRRVFESTDTVWAGSRIQSGLSSGEGLIHAVRDPLATKDNAESAHVVADAGVEDKRLLIVETEFSSVLKVATRAGNLLTGIIRQAWDSGNLRLMTKNSPAAATDAHISVLGHIPKHELNRLIDETDAANGFANRFLWVCVRRSKLLPEGGYLGDDKLAPIIRGVQSALDFARRQGEVKRNDAARELWASVYPRLSSGRPGLLGAVLSRAEAQTVRLSLLYALLDRSPVIREDHLRAALALWEYCSHSAAYIFGERLGDPTADTILAALRTKPEGLTRTEISNLLSRNISRQELDSAIARLVQQNLTYTSADGAGGRGRPVERLFAKV